MLISAAQSVLCSLLIDSNFVVVLHSVHVCNCTNDLRKQVYVMKSASDGFLAKVKTELKALLGVEPF